MKRYDWIWHIDEFEERKHGAWVRYEDVRKTEAEITRIKGLNREMVGKLKIFCDKVCDADKALCEKGKYLCLIYEALTKAE